MSLRTTLPVTALALLAPLLAACGDQAESAVPRSAACKQPKPGTTVQTVVSGGQRRQYRLHVPAGRPRALPLVLAFHGRGESAQRLEKYSGMNKYPALVAYPDGTPTKGGAKGWQGAPYSSGTDDVRFTRDLIAQIKETACVNTRRVYAVGKSNGGGFANLLACRLSSQLAAVAPVVGAYYDINGKCRPSRPVPILSFHGTADRTTPYAGHKTRKLPHITRWATAWASRNGCDTTPRTFYNKHNVKGLRWSACRANATIEHYKLIGGTHHWPGALTPSDPNGTKDPIRATPLIWRFLTKHHL
ncbi:alpha/beta hydrolase family esterase [Actinomadura sp. 6N118]|uniref:alpha/beta hydrolase family esterase n=1 Tax=Actinomadura sp. 6N118 TaxID=3375151 RepID=UPI0037AB37A2